MIATRRRLMACMAALGMAALSSWAMAQSPPAFDGLKKTISVDPFLATEAVGGSVTSDGMTAMLIDALVRDASVVNSWSGAALGGGTLHATPIGQAGQDAIIKAVDQIATGMRDVPWSALVIDASEAGVYLNAGADRNVQPGLVRNVYKAGRTFTDPSTGEVLDREMARVGAVRVETVREHISTAMLVSGELPARGDLLKLD